MDSNRKLTNKRIEKRDPMNLKIRQTVQESVTVKKVRAVPAVWMERSEIK